MTDEFVKTQIVFSVDKTYAHLHSADICKGIKPGVERDEAFKKAVETVEKLGYEKTDYEIETIDGGCTQYFKKI